MTMGYYADLAIQSEIDSYSRRISGQTNKSFKCDECGKPFGNKKSLAQHKTAKHRANETKCDLCDRMAFGSAKALKMHKEAKH